MERITIFKGAYDKRDPDPKKNYGIHGMHCFMVLKGDKGATHFIWNTGILLDRTMVEYIKEGRAKYEMSGFGDHYHYLNQPMAYDVGYHSLVPQYEGQTSRENCEWLDGRPCYGDGSALRAEEWFKIFVEKGSEEIWKMLEDEYNEMFNK